jgi:hypothetical protein
MEVIDVDQQDGVRLGGAHEAGVQLGVVSVKGRGVGQTSPVIGARRFGQGPVLIAELLDLYG